MNAKEAIGGDLLDDADAVLRDAIEDRLGIARGPRTPDVRPLLRELQLAVPAAETESGHFRWLPHGALVRRLLKDWLESFVLDAFGAAEVETPLFFRWAEPQSPLGKQAGSFAERLYGVARGDKGEDSMLRYGGDPGFFNLFRGATFRAEALPLRVWEFVEAYRRERSGELRGIHRARSFSYFDCHSICADKSRAIAEYFRVLDLQHIFMSRFLTSYFPQVSIVADAADERTALQDWARRNGTYALVDVVSRQKHYYTLAHDIRDRFGLLTMHGQLDLDSAHVWSMATEDDLSPVVVHAATGTLERWLTAFLADAMARLTPRLPTWLSPVQVRILPLSDAQIVPAERLAVELTSHGIRVDIDDRPVRFAQRIRTGDREWIPYLVAIGRDEVDRGILDVRERGRGRGTVSPAALISRIQADLGDLPRRAVRYARLSSRHSFS